MRNRLGNARTWFGPRGHCVIALSRGLLSVQRVSGSRKSAPVYSHRALDGADLLEADRLGALLAAALDEVEGRGLPVHATLGDDLARYFIVTPPANSGRLQDLRAAASVRFLSLYGDTVSGWHLHADWQAVEPFLACAVPRRVTAALEQAVNARHGCLISVMPNFVGAWNRSRQYLGTNAWLATLDGRALTLGLLGATPKPRLASVRTLLLPEPVPPLDWLRGQIARMALLDDVSPPSVLYVQGTPVGAWTSAAAAAHDVAVAKLDTAMTVHWVAPGRRAAPRAGHRPWRVASRVASFAASLRARFAWGGSAS